MDNNKQKLVNNRADSTLDPNYQDGIYLASQSPRRAELLQQIGMAYQVIPTDVDETPLHKEAPGDYVERVALAKARSGWAHVQAQKLPLKPVLGADTAVILTDQILGKPRDQDHGLAMLRALSGTTHHVMSAICLCYQQRELTALNVSEVSFRQIGDLELQQYWDSGEPNGKAGAYAIQGHGAKFIRHLTGSYSAVMGLPLFETHQLLADIFADNKL